MGRAPRRDRRPQRGPVRARRPPRHARHAAQPAAPGPARRAPGRGAERDGAARVGPAPQRAARRHQGEPRRRRRTPATRRTPRSWSSASASAARTPRSTRSSGTTPPATVAALQLVDAPCRAAQAAQGGPTPRYGFDFPDPFVLVAGTDHWAFATNCERRQHPGAAPPGRRRVGDGGGRARPVPGLGRPGKTWAPSVLPRLIGFVMYYTVREAATGRQCVSRATSLGPGGPYVDTSTGPLVCGDREALDPEAVVARRRHAGAAVEARAAGRDRRPAADPRRARARRHRARAAAREPALGGHATSRRRACSSPAAARGCSSRAATGTARSTRRASCTARARSARATASGAAPLLASHDRIAGPGGASVFQDAPGTFGLAYHAYVSPNVGYPASRLLFTATIDLRSGRPVIVDESTHRPRSTSFGGAATQRLCRACQRAWNVSSGADARWERSVDGQHRAPRAEEPCIGRSGAGFRRRELQRHRRGDEPRGTAAGVSRPTGFRRLRAPAVPVLTLGPGGEVGPLSSRAPGPEAGRCDRRHSRANSTGSVVVRRVRGRRVVRAARRQALSVRTETLGWVVHGTPHETARRRQSSVDSARRTRLFLRVTDHAAAGADRFESSADG